MRAGKRFVICSVREPGAREWLRRRVARRTGKLRPNREPVAIMIVCVNGVSREIAAGMTLGQLIVELGIRRDGIAVARNDDVVVRSAIDATPLAENDAIEIIAAVAGG